MKLHENKTFLRITTKLDYTDVESRRQEVGTYKTEGYQWNTIKYPGEKYQHNQHDCTQQ